MNPIWSLVVLAMLAGISLSANAPTSTSSYLTQGDIEKMKKILDVAYKFDDLSAAYWQAVGYQHLGEGIARSAEICKLLITEGNKAGLTLESIFYVSGAWKIIKTCQPASLNSATLIKQLNSVLEKETASVLELYYAVSSLVAFGHKIPETSVAKIVKNVQGALKKDDNILNLGHAFHIASELGAAGSFATKNIEEAIIQADEVDGQFLQFEGGLSVTSHVINGIYKLSSALKKKPEIKPLQVVKFANYFLSRRSVQTPKGAANFLSSIHLLANNPWDKPICITVAEDGLTVSSKQPLIKVKVCSILGKPLSATPSVVADSATKIGDEVVVLNKKSLQNDPKDKTIYTLNFLEAKPEPGFYKIVVSAGSVQNTIVSKVLTEVKVENLEIGTADADQTTPPKLSKLVYPNQRSTKIEVDSQQKIVLRFSLKDVTKNKLMRVHQAFVRLSAKGKQEIIFVAEPDSSHLYKFDMVVGTAAKTFNYLSGEYDIELIIGDAILSNPIQWKLGSVVLKFPEATSTDVAEKSVLKQPPNVYSVKPEIRHMFREPEKRPPAFVSNLFTGLCLASNLLLVGLWLKLGINVSNFPFTLSSVTFHLGLGSIFVLYFVFWWKLNMFTTLRYLFVLGIVTFLSGNKLLSHIARNRKAVSR